jgi:hypothetical protein
MSFCNVLQTVLTETDEVCLYSKTCIHLANKPSDPLADHSHVQGYRGMYVNQNTSMGPVPERVEYSTDNSFRIPAKIHPGARLKILKILKILED